MKFNDLIQKHTWSDIESVFLNLYPRESKAIKSYASTYDELLSLVPVVNDLSIVVEEIWVKELKQNEIDVYGKTNEDRFRLDLILWPEWLDMQMDETTLANFSEEEIISHCLYEMTMNGHTLAEAAKHRDLVLSQPPLTEEERDYFNWEHENSHAVTQFEIIGPYTLHLTFDDGTDRTIDFEHALRTIYRSPMYEPLLDPAYFAQVVIDDNGILTWPNGIDFNPAYIYKWDESIAMIENNTQST